MQGDARRCREHGGEGIDVAANALGEPEDDRLAEAVEKQPETLEAMEAMLAAIAEAQTPAEA